MPSLPVAQPRNVFGGMVVSCMAGLFWRTILGTYVMVAAPLGVAFSIIGMQLTATLHRATLALLTVHNNTRYRALMPRMSMFTGSH